MHHVAFVRSPHAHARIRGIDVKPALNRPGVVAVVTGQDLQPQCGPMPIGGGEGGAAASRRRYAADPLPALDRPRPPRRRGGGRGHRRTPERRRRRPPTSRSTGSRCPRWPTSSAALADGAPQLFDDAPKNIEHENHASRRGDPDAAFAKATTRGQAAHEQPAALRRADGAARGPGRARSQPRGGADGVGTHQAPHVLRGDSPTRSACSRTRSA